MKTSIVKYLGDLRTESVHLTSNASIINDAPLDNNGKGEAFSPTDLLANSLASCILITIGIKAKASDWMIESMEAEVTKVMQGNPRMISEIQIELNFKIPEADKKMKTIIENTAKNCPVFLSLNPEITKTITFNWYM